MSRTISILLLPASEHHDSIGRGDEKIIVLTDQSDSPYSGGVFFL